jgi:hypothetical protein
MPGKRFGAEQIIPTLREAEMDLAKGLTVAQARKKIGGVHLIAFGRADSFWQPLINTAPFPGRLSDTKGSMQYELLGRSIALLRLTTPAIEENKKRG